MRVSVVWLLYHTSDIYMMIITRSEQKVPQDERFSVSS